MIVREIDIDCYTIKFDSKPIYEEGSADNLHHYNAVYLNAPEREGTKYDIAVFFADDLEKRVLIQSSGGSTTIHKTSFVAEPDRLVICCSNTVFCLSIPDLLLLWKTEADDVTCFQIFKHQSDYIIHGELAISRINHNGEVLWQRSGGDIFVKMHSLEEDFVITDNHILVTDWENRRYKFDFNGNSIY
jgi:hypothetical protein